MFCIECGKEISASANFCPSCGASQTVSENSKKTDNDQTKELNKLVSAKKRKEEFLKLPNEEIRKIILSEISNLKKNNHKRSNYIKEIVLDRFDRKFYYGQMRKELYNDLFNKDTTNLESKRLIIEHSTNREEIKSKEFNNIKPVNNWNSKSILKGFFFIWLTNTILANTIGTGTSLNNVWEGWYIPPLSEITPVLIKEISFFGEGDFRLATQAEVWRMNRNVRKLREGIEDITGEDLDLDNLKKDFDKNLKNFQDLLEEMKEDLDN